MCHLSRYRCYRHEMYAIFVCVCFTIAETPKIEVIFISVNVANTSTNRHYAVFVLFRVLIC